MRPVKIVSLLVGIALTLSYQPTTAQDSSDEYYTYVVIGAFRVLSNAENHTQWAKDNGLNAAFAMNPNRGLNYVYSYQTRNMGAAIEEVYKVRALVEDAWVYTGPLEGMSIDNNLLAAKSTDTSSGEGGRENLVKVEHSSGLPAKGAVMFGFAGPNSKVSAVIEGATYETTAKEDGTWMIDLVNDTPISRGDGTKKTGTNLGGTAEPGEKISVDIMGKKFVTFADENGEWSLNSTGSPTEIGTGSVLTGKAESGSTVTAMIGGIKYIAGADENGNWRIDPVDDDAAAIDPENTNSGVVFGGDAGAGSLVTTSLGGETFTTDADADGNWSLQAGSKELVGKSGANSKVTAIVGSATYTVVADENGKWTVDAINDAPEGEDVSENVILIGQDEPNTIVKTTIEGEEFTTVADADGNWKINTAEKPMGGDAEPGSIIRAQVGGAMYETRVDEDGVWTIDPQRDEPVSVGHKSTGSGHILSGKAEPGFKVETSIGGHTYNAVADSEGNWSINTEAQSLSGMGDPGSTITAVIGGATYTTTANEFGAWKVDPKTMRPVSVSTTIEGSGTAVTGKGEPGTIVTTKISGKTYSTIVGKDGNWSIDPQSKAMVGVAIAGEEVSAVIEGKKYTTTASDDGTWKIDPVTDTPTESVSAEESQSGTVLEGKAEAGKTIEAIVDGEIYMATADEEGNWSIDTHATDLSGITTSGSTITATVNGKKHNVTASEDGSWGMRKGENGLEFQTGDDVVLEGTGEPGEIIMAKVGNKVFEVVANERGEWKIDTAEGQNATFFKETEVSLDQVTGVEVAYEELRPPEVIAPEGVPEPEVDGDFKAFINSYNDEFQRVKGPVEILDVVRLRKMKDATTQTLIGIKDPKNGSTSVEIVSRIFGYRPFSVNFNLNDPIETDTTNNVTTNGDSIIIAMPLHRLEKGDIAVMWNVLFYKDAAIMRPESRPELNSLLEMLKAIPDMNVILHGHTNSNKGGKIIHLNERDTEYFSMNADHNESKGSAKKLSEERAYTIQQWLISQGIAPERTEVKGWGGKKMLYETDDPLAYRNVRVEVEIK